MRQPSIGCNGHENGAPESKQNKSTQRLPWTCGQTTNHRKKRTQADNTPLRDTVLVDASILISLGNKSNYRDQWIEDFFFGIPSRWGNFFVNQRVFVFGGRIFLFHPPGECSDMADVVEDKRSLVVVGSLVERTSSSFLETKEDSPSRSSFAWRSRRRTVHIHQIIPSCHFCLTIGRIMANSTTRMLFHRIVVGV